MWTAKFLSDPGEVPRQEKYIVKILVMGIFSKRDRDSERETKADLPESNVPFRDSEKRSPAVDFLNVEIPQSEQRGEPLDGREAVCPHCNGVLKKIPGAKTKCPLCYGYIYVRTEPTSNTRILVSESRANEIDDEWGELSKSSDNDAVAIVERKDFIEEILERHRISIPGIETLDLEKVIQVCAKGVAFGWGYAKVARRLESEIKDPILVGPEGISLKVAWTLCSATVAERNYDSFIQLGVEKVEWSAGICCEMCTQNDGQVVEVGKEFKSGHLYPPACATCSCIVMSQSDLPEGFVPFA